MTGASWLTSIRNLFERDRGRTRAVRRILRMRALHRAEPLEGRRVMAFDFVAAFPNFGQFITEGATLREAPQQITIRFSPGTKVDPSTLGAISVVRAGADGVLGNVDDVNVTPTGFVGIVAVDDFPNENQVVVRFAENLPDDLYRLTITGGLKTLANGPAAPAESFRNGGRLDLNFRLDLGAQVVSVVPQPVVRQPNGTLSQARDTVVVYFNANDPLLASSAQNVGNYRLVETDPVTGADVAVRLPQSVAYATVDGSGRRTSRATLTFDGDLGDKLYRLQIGASDDDNNLLATATVVGTLFQQPGGVTPAFTTNSFLGDGAAAANDVDLYKVALPAGATLSARIVPDAALDAAVRIFDATGVQVAILGATGPGSAATVTYTPGTAGEFFVGISSVDGLTRGGYRIELSSNVAPSADDENSSFGTATSLGVLGVGGKALNAAIDVRPTVPTSLGSLLFPSQPGTVDEPGHREIPILLETHDMPAASLGAAASAEVFPYNFRTNYGVDGQGNTLVNAITEIQKQRAREIFDHYSMNTGIRFVETESSGLTVVTGDIRAVDPNLPVPNGPAGICGNGLAVMNGSLDWGQSEYGGSWYDVAMHEIGHALGLGHSYDVDANMGGDAPSEGVIPGDHDLIHLSVLLPKNGSDIDVYSFALEADGRVSLETIVARPGQPVISFADTVLTLYREDPATGAHELVSRNDDFYGRDSFIGINLPARNPAGSRYTYYLTVTSTGTTFDPNVENSGNGGRSDGGYQLKLAYTPAAVALNTIVDATGTAIDGDRDGDAGGAFNFWFQSSTATNTVFVDKLAPAAGADGSLAKPFPTVAQGLAAAGGAKQIVRIVGNNLGSPAAATPYLIGTSLAGQPLADGAEFVVPQNVTVMIDEGAVFKLRAQVIDVGSSTSLVSRQGAALQVLGTPDNQVQFTSYHDDTIGGNSDGVGPARSGGQWGGIVLRGDSDSSTRSVFLNSISQAVMQYGGGQVRVNGQLQSFAPIHLEKARPTLTFNTVRYSAGAALSADPNSFEETASRRGPVVRGNRLTDNSINGMFVRIRTQFGQPIDTLDVPAVFTSRDITYVLAENLLINGGVGGYDATSGTALARATGRLLIDPGVVVKLQGSRIELGRGNAQLIAEGDPQNRVIFTSAADNRFGGGGTFDVFGTQANQPAAGDWGGIVVNAAAQASIDNAYIAYGGGQTSIEGGFDKFNVVEVHQGRLRLANSRLENNASGAAETSRTGRGTNAAATIFVRGAQPVIVGNDFRNNLGAVVSINVNALSDLQVPDPGRSTGPIGRYGQYDDNSGPLVRSNTLAAVSPNGGIGGMVVRGGEVTVEGVWDDTDIVHVVMQEILVNNFHTATGLRLMSSPNASLVVKLSGANAGLTAAGDAGDIDDRIGGTVQVLGQPGYPVVMTSLEDDSVGASRNPLGVTVKDTNGDGPSTGTAGDWRGLKFLPYSNDRNVSVLREAENAFTGGVDANRIPVTAQYLGVLAPSEKGGDDNRRLGFEVHGFISGDDTGDVDVYSFEGYPGSEVWIDIDKTSALLDTMLELLDASGRVLARSVDSQTDVGLAAGVRGIGGDLQKNAALGEDYYTQNPRDAGMRVVLPGVISVPPQTTQYFVRVRSQPRVAATASTADLEAAVSDEARVREGATSGRYELRMCLQQRDEKPGSTVRYADIRYPVVGIDVQGLPQHSPLVGENGEAGANETPATAQTLGNLLAQDRNAISVAGVISSAADVDWYAVDLAYEDIQAIGGVNAGKKSWATVFDIDYADGFRGDLTISVFNSQGQLMYVGRDSNIAADQPTPGQGNGFDDLTKGSAGQLDPFIGPAQLPTGTPGAPERYYVAISSNEQLPAVLDATFKSAATNTLIRLAPINSVRRVVEDHIGFEGYHSGVLYTGNDIADYTDVPPTSGPLFDLPNLENQVAAITLEQVQLFLSSSPGPNSVGIAADDLAMRSDGWLYNYVGVAGAANTAGRLSRQSIVGGGGVIGLDNIPNNTNPTYQETNLATTNGVPIVTTTNFALSATNVTALTPLDPASLTGVVQYSAPINGTAVTGTWTFTTSPAGQLTFTSANTGGPPAGLQTPLSGTAAANGQITVTWSDPVIITATGTNANPTLAQVSYSVIPDRNAVTTDRVDALAWRRRPGLVGPLFDRLFYSVRDVNGAGQETGVSRLYNADVNSGNASAGRVGDVIQTGGNDLGLTTGMAFMGTTLYGVDDRGNLFTIDTATAVATLIRNVTGTPLQGLALGPQNVRGGPNNTPGYFANKLFAIDEDGDMWCFDTAGNLLPVFNGSTSRYMGLLDGTGNRVPGSFTGLAFSPIDVNLWRATNVRSGDVGHGVPVTLDNTLDAAFDDFGSRPAEAVGGTSIYFGFDASGGTAVDDTELKHLGVVSSTWASDLTSGIGTSTANVPIPGSSVVLTGDTTAGRTEVTVSSTTGLLVGMTVVGAGIPDGATIARISGVNQIELSQPAQATNTDVDLRFVGDGMSITTLPFSLANYTYTDKPTLYFNYWISAGGGVTVKASGVGTWTRAAELMQGSDLVEVSSTLLLATGMTVSGTGIPVNTTVIGVDPNLKVVQLSNNVTISGVAALTFQGASARITIATNAHDRSTLDSTDKALPAFPSVSSRIGTQPNQIAQEMFENTGWRQARIDLGELAGASGIELQFNASGGGEGVYIDDLIVGFAERGEIVTGALANQTGFFDVGTPVSFTTPQQNLQGPYQLEIRRGVEFGELTSPKTGAVQVQPSMQIDTNDSLVRGIANPNPIVEGSQYRGDDNTPRDQGQFIIESNSIYAAQTYGIRIDAAAREADTNAPVPGAVQNGPVLNSSRLVPGVVVVNNIVSTSGLAGVLFSGDTNAGSGETAAVPFGRILNNTIYGGGTPQGVGVDVRDNAGPTLLNNLFANLATAVSVDASSAARTVVGTSAFFNTTTQVAGVASDRPIVLTGNPFVNAAAGNFYPVAGTPAIDSSLDVLQERSDYAAVISPLGIPVSPIIAPARDLYGQLRSDDPSQASAPGLGAAVFKDRGAVDRVDFTQPWMSLATPLDQSQTAPVDRDPAADQVRLEREEAASVTRFVLQLNDVGVGLDKSTVVKEAFEVVRDGTVTLVEGVDYLFRFLESSNQVVLESASVFPLGEYVITATSRPTAGATTGLLTDLANNPLLPNLVDGSTRFVIALVDVPGAPLALTGVPGDQQVTLSWQAPATGGGGITDYVIESSVDGGTNWSRYTEAVSTATSVVVTGLTNGTTYVFRVRAVNALGDGLWSAVSVPAVPEVPAPGSITATAGNTEVLLTWTAPVVTGSTVIDDYVVQYSSNSGGTWTTFAEGVSTATSATVTGLTNGTLYLVRVAALSGGVRGAFGQAAVVTPRTVADAPTGVDAVVGNGQVTLSWTAPVFNGGAAITDYMVEYSIDAGTSWATFADGLSVATSAVVTGLTGGIPHLFRVAAVNVAGLGAYGVSAAVTPVTVAGAPTGVSGVAGNREVVVSWTTPVSNGGAAITDYAVQFSSNGGTSWTTFADGVSASTSTTVTGLTNGTAYVFRVAAINVVGTGAYGQSATVTPRTVAGTPTGLAGIAGDRQVTLSWSAPASNGGAAITDYIVHYSSNGGASWITFNDGTSATTSATVTGLTNGTTYLFQVAAVNAAGSGAFAQSAAFTPRSVAGAPSGVAGTAGNGQVALSWLVPADNGGAAITDYAVQYSSNGGASWTTFADGVSAGLSATVTGLTNGTAYLFRVAAVNVVGTGAFGQSAGVVPRTVPTAPRNLLGAAGDRQVVLQWAAPASNGGAAITDYVITYSADGGATYVPFVDAVSVSRSVTVTGLTNGTNYLFRVRAVNSAGAGPVVQSLAVRPFTPLTAPTGLAATLGNSQVTLTWIAPSSSRPIVDYRVQYRIDAIGSTWQTFADGASTAARAVVTGLTNGTRYLFRVAGVTDDGIGRYTDGTLAALPVAPPTSAPSAVRGSGSRGVITLSWTAAPSTPQAPVTGYVIQYRANTTSAQWVTLPLDVGSQTTATITTLTSRLGYRFRVAARNAAGIGAWSAESALIRPY